MTNNIYVKFIGELTNDAKNTALNSLRTDMFSQGRATAFDTINNLLCSGSSFQQVSEFCEHQKSYLATKKNAEKFGDRKLVNYYSGQQSAYIDVARFISTLPPEVFNPTNHSA